MEQNVYWSLQHSADKIAAVTMAKKTIMNHPGMSKANMFFTTTVFEHENIPVSIEVYSKGSGI